MCDLWNRKFLYVLDKDLDLMQTYVNLWTLFYETNNIV